MQGTCDPAELMAVSIACARTETSECVDGFIACEGGRPVGALRLFRSGSMCYISDLDVHPAHRRRGVGQALLAHAIRQEKDRAITLYTASDNVGAIRLYESHGFEFLGESATLYPPAKLPG